MGGKRYNRGNMPFAIVAVAILVIASAYGAIVKLTEDSEKAAESVKDDIQSLDSAVESFDSFVRTGLGELIYDISTDRNGGTLDDRVTSFYDRVETWVNFQFPRNISGTTMTVSSYDIGLDSVILQYNDSNYSGNGYVPSYLQATGSMVVKFENSSGTAVRTVPVSSDGSCALPLTTEMGSMFENAISQEGSILAQMVSYQLTCLAQTKVINGYGLYSSSGTKGTTNLITKEDVEKAYSESLKAIESLYLRNGTETEYLGSVDIVKSYLAPDGYVDIDLNMVYAHALYAIADDIVLKWFDYIGGTEVLQICDFVDDTLQNAWDDMVSWLTGTNVYSAEKYIRGTCGDLDYDLYSGKTFELHFYDSGHDDFIILNYPSVDLMGSSTVSNFVKTYRSNNNFMLSWLTNVVNGAIKIIADNSSLGSVRVYLDDERSYAETLSEEISKALKENKTDLWGVFFEQVTTIKCPNEFYASIYDAINNDKEELFGFSETYWYDTYRHQIVSMMTAVYHSRMDLEDASRKAEEQADKMFEQDSELMQILGSYQSKVKELLKGLEPLKEKDGGMISTFQSGCRALTIGGLLFTDLAVDIFPELNSMMEDFMLNLSSDPYYGYTLFPENNSFELIGDKVYSEYLNFSGSSHPHISIGSASNSRSTHQAAWEDDEGASFCTVIPVTIKDELNYNITSSGTLMSALGLVDSAYSGNSNIDMTLYIPVMSGWALEGVTYKTDNTLLDNAVSKLVKALEPLVEPLMKVINTAQELLNVLNRISVEINRYVTEMVVELYERISEPIENIYDILVEKLGDAFCQMVVDKGQELSSIIDVTLEKQIVGFAYMGWEVLFIFNLSTLGDTEKDVVKMQISGAVAGNDLKAFIDIKAKGSKNTAYATGGFSMTSKEWKVSGTIDPKMESKKNLLSVTGIYKSLEMDMVLPSMVEYREVTLSLSDVDFLGGVLNNLPSPIAGTKASIDAGIDIKYNAPIETGILINEVELNPTGNDAGNEWVEIVNMTAKTTNLKGWYITTSKGKTHYLDDKEIAPGEKYVVRFTGSFLNNTDEKLTLYNSAGKSMDVTPKIRDELNDDQTYQRAIDGCTKWLTTDGTPGSANRGALLDTNGLITSEIIDIFKKSAKKAMTELDHVTDTEGLSELFRNTLLYALELGIDKLSSCLVEAAIFVKVEITDYVGTVGGGFRIYLMAGQTMAKDVLKYLVGRAAEIVCNLEDPYKVDLGEAVMEDVFLGVTVYGGISTPTLLKKLGGNPESIDLGVDFKCNMSAIAEAFGNRDGDPKISVGVYVKNCPTEMVPSALKPTKGITHDLWLIKATFTRYE